MLSITRRNAIARGVAQAVCGIALTTGIASASGFDPQAQAAALLYVAAARHAEQPAVALPATDAYLGARDAQEQARWMFEGKPRSIDTQRIGTLQSTASGTTDWNRHDPQDSARRVILGSHG